MKASLSTIQNIGGSAKDVLEIGTADLVKLATNRLGGLEGVENYGDRFDGAIVVKVVSCVDHPDSDHLRVCMVDDGGVVKGLDRDANGLVQVVCGAPNITTGQTVVWLPPGTTVPKSRDEAEPFILGKREIRGIVSNGMIASPSELGLYDNHDGILVIDESEVGADLSRPGTEFRKLYGLDDLLLDFENKMFTHRPDCFGQIGLARELAGIQGLAYSSPGWYLNGSTAQKTASEDKKVVSGNEIKEKVPRFMLRVVDELSIKQSPVWMQAYLSRVGIKSINNIVDWSNYYMHLTAQPTHAFDYDKVKNLCSGGVTIFPRMANRGEKLKLLNGKEIELSEDDIVIATDKQPIALGGIMGGSETEVDEKTKTIIIESATFDMYTIRRTSMKHGLFTDAVTRNTKGQSPLQNDKVLSKIVSEMIEHDGAVAGMIYDSGVPEVAFTRSIEVTPEFINSRLGTELSKAEIMQLLINVEIGVESNADEIVVTPPFWRTDLELKEDIVEEVGRLYGFDRLELKLPSRSVKPAPKNEADDYKTSLRLALSSAGANEVLSYSFVRGDDLRKMGIEDVEKWCYHIRNAISPDLQYYRPSLMTSLLTKVQQNLRSDMIRCDDNEFGLFEIGKAHVKGHLDEEGLPAEMERVVFVFAADDKTAKRKYMGSALYMAKQYLLPFIGGQVEFAPLESNEYPITAPYEKARSATIAINGQVLGVIGEFRSSVKKAFKLPDYCAGFEIDLNLLKQNMKVSGYEPIGTYPKTQQDITLSVDQEIKFSEVFACILGELSDSKTEKGYEVRLMPRDIFQTDLSDRKNLTFRIWLWHPEKTLKTEEVNKLLDGVAMKAKEALNAERI
jgi:phenylalanyl-tRNA synthetase beta chain